MSNEPSVASVQAWALAQNHQSVSARYAKMLAIELGRLGAEAVAQVALVHKQLGEIDDLRNEVGRLQERADFYERKWNELVGQDEAMERLRLDSQALALLREELERLAKENTQMRNSTAKEIVCSRCGRETLFYAVMPYGSPEDGDPVCVECLNSTLNATDWQARAEKAEAELKQKQKDYDWMIAQHDVWRLCSFEESKRKKKSEAEAERLRDTCQDALTQFSDFFDAARVTAGNDDLDGRPLNDIEKKLRAALACRTDDDAPKARQLRTSAEVKGLREEWFNKGRESVLRKNQSGCCCLFDENDNIVSLCDAHRAWAEAELARWKPLIEAAEELLEVAALRGDADLPHPADDPKLWTARMQTAWDELRAAALAYREAKEKP